MKIEDDNSDHFNDINEEHLMKAKELIEIEFFKTLELGKDFSKFVYIPIELLSDKVKAYLDKFTYEKAYHNMFETDNLEVVYEDEFLKIEPPYPAKLRILQTILRYFTDTEEYEKCINIHKEIQRIEHYISTHNLK